MNISLILHSNHFLNSFTINLSYHFHNIVSLLSLILARPAHIPQTSPVLRHLSPHLTGYWISPSSQSTFFYAVRTHSSQWQSSRQIEASASWRHSSVCKSRDTRPGKWENRWPCRLGRLRVRRALALLTWDRRWWCPAVWNRSRMGAWLTWLGIGSVWLRIIWSWLLSCLAKPLEIRRASEDYLIGGPFCDETEN